MKKFQINTQITTNFLDQLEPELVAIFYARLMTYRNRFIPPKLMSFLFALVKPVSLIGLASSLLLMFFQHGIFKSLENNVAAILFFLLALTISWNKQKLEKSVWGIYQPVWRRQAKVRAQYTLDAARKVAPFFAEYEFNDATATYRRQNKEISAVIWTQKMKGYYLSSSKITLLFNKEKSLRPHTVILHDNGEELARYLDELGVKALHQGKTL